jgi:type I restriction enzyme S subunit
MMQPYSEYKNTEIDWLETIPKNWKLVKLKHVSSLNMGQSPSSDDVNQEGEGIPFIQGNAEFGALHPTPKNFCTEPSKICKPDDILISVRAPVGALNISDQKYVIGRGLSAITPESVRSGFCWYALQNSKYQLSVMETGTTFKAISGSDLANVFLPLPSQEEQRVIEGYLNFETSRIDRLITEKAGFIDLLKEKRQALISHVVTKGLDSDVAMKDSGVEWIGQVPKHWSIGKLKYFLNAIGDVDHYMPESIDDGIPYVMTGDLTELVSDIHFEHCKKVSERDYLKLSKKIKTSKGDVIMARYATIGTLSYVDIDKNFLVSYSCVTINPNHAQLLGLYLFYYLKSHTFLHGIQNHINTNTQGNVGINDLRKVEICVPSLQEQERIINFLSEKTLSIDTIIKETERSINLLKEHRTALISAAVTGKIDLRDKEVA